MKIYQFKFPDVGEGLHEGKVFEIHVKHGDSIAEGGNLFSVETDKLTTDVVSPVSGKIHKVLIEPGQVIHVGDVVIEIEQH